MPVPLIAAAAFGGVVATTIRFFVGYAIVRAITALGISFIAYEAVEAIGQQIQTQLLSNMQFGEYTALVQYMGVFAWVQIVTSAYLGAIAVRKILGAFNRVSIKGPARS